MCKKLTTLVFVALIAISCAPKNSDENSGGPNSVTPAKEVDANQFVDEIILKYGMPKKAETISYTFPRFYDLNSSTECAYHTDVNIAVDTSDNSELIFNGNLKSEGFKNNDAACPGSHPNHQAQDTEKYSVQEYINNKKTYLKEVFSPSVRCKAWKSCKSIQLLKVENVNYKKIDALYIESQAETTSGKKYILKSWVSKTSLLQGEFEFDIRNMDTDYWLDYKTLNNFSN